MPNRLGRCTFPGCIWRWRDGINRPCAEHDDDDRAAILGAARELGIDLSSAPGSDRDDQDGAQ